MFPITKKANILHNTTVQSCCKEIKTPLHLSDTGFKSLNYDGLCGSLLVIRAVQ